MAVRLVESDDAGMIVPHGPEPRREAVVMLPRGRSMGYAEYGPADGRPLLWFHGTPGARRQIPPDIEAEATKAGFRIIVMERPGTGLSSPYRHGQVIDWAADVENFADILELDRFAVVGLSGGGPFVLACCHELPKRVVAGAVLGGIGPTRGREAAPGYTRLLPVVEPFLNLVRIPLGEALTHLVRPLRSVADKGFSLYTMVAPAADRPIMRQPDVKAMFLDDICQSAEGGLRSPAADLVLFGRDWGFSLRDIHVPVKIWHGDADGIVPLSHGEYQSSMIPNAELVVCPGGGHFAGFMLAGRVLEWVDQKWPAPSVRVRSKK